MPFWHTVFHIVWATKGRQPLITPEMERVLYPVLVDKCSEHGGWPLAASGMPDHVHLVVAIPPSVLISRFVGTIKGATSYVLKSEFHTDFAWQEGYGIFTVSKKSVSDAVAYVRNQKQHHADGTTYPDYERSEADNIGPDYIPPKSAEV
jgi:putative transposase